MRRAWKRLSFGLVLAMLLAAVVFFVWRRRRLQAPEDTLVIGVPNLPQAGEVLSPTSASGRLVASLIFDGLLRVDGSGELAPSLAESFSVRHELTLPFCPTAKLPNGKTSTEAGIREYILMRMTRVEGAPLTAVRSIEGIPGHENRLRIVLSLPVPGIRLILREGLGDKVFPPVGGEESSGDRFVVSFVLRQGVSWHDGRSFTAADVKRTAEMMKDRFPGLRHPSGFGLVKEIRVIDDHHIEFEYMKAVGQSLWDWLTPILPAHLWSGDAGEPDPRDARSLVGTGPFRWQGVDPESGAITLSRAARPFDPAPAQVGKIQLVLEEGGSESLEKMRAKVIDAIEADLVDPSTRARLQSAADQACQPAGSPGAPRRSGAAGQSTAGGLELCLVFNLRSVLFHDGTLRKVICDIVDGPAIAAFLGDSSRAVTSPLTVPADRRLQESIVRLKALGWSDADGDHVLDMPGKRLRFDCLIPEWSMTADLAGRMICEDLNRAGCGAAIGRLDWKTFSGRLESGDFDVAMTELDFSHAADLQHLWHSSAVKAGTSLCGLANPEADRLLDSVAGEYSVRERTDTARRFCVFLSQEAVVVFLGAAHDLVWREDLPAAKRGLMDYIRGRN
ncbi:MAG: ABC transporter substrate-binding protein [Planctomycetota bacterium]|nr:ABC transporter substrate-binding protein [Planctomycetota bacterium]